MKHCRKCGKGKTLNNFYRHNQMSDGYLNHCKECVCKRTLAYSKTEQGKIVERKREQTDKRKKWKVEYQRKSRKRNLQKYKARMAVGNALRDGRLIKKPCSVCANPKSEAHHEDYSKPFKILWLCFKHHRGLMGQSF